MTIIFGTLGVIIETLPQFYGERHQFWFIFEAVMITIFSLEFSLRCLANSESWDQFWAFAASFFTLVDLLSIIPFYLELIIQGQHIGEFQKFTILRLFRLLRLLRTFQTSVLLKMSVEAMIIAVQRSFETLVPIVFFLVLIVIVSATMIYYVERGEYDPARRRFIDIDGLPSKFDSIPSTFWFVIEIVTTVGLGDVYPKTSAGRVMTFPVMMFGLIIIALPSIVIGRNFADAWAWLKVNRVGRRTSIFSSAAAPADVPPLDSDVTAPAVPKQPSTHRTVGSDDLMEGLLHEMRRQNALLERLMQSQRSEV
jgi:hypothetical protein